MNKSPYATIRVRCYNCKKVFEAKFEKGKEIPDNKMVEKERPCAKCGKNNIIKVPADLKPVEPMYRGVIQGVPAEKEE